MDTLRPDHDDSDGAVVNPSDNPTFESVLAARLSRRALLTGAAAGLVVVATGFTSVAGSTDDKVIVPPGYRATVVLR